MPRKSPIGYARRSITLSALVPVYVEDDEVAGFVADSLEHAGGCRPPYDPFFHSIAVKQVKLRGVTYENPDEKVLDDLHPEDVEPYDV